MIVQIYYLSGYMKQAPQPFSLHMAPLGPYFFEQTTTLREPKSTSDVIIAERALRRKSPHRNGKRRSSHCERKNIRPAPFPTKKTGIHPGIGCISVFSFLSRSRLVFKHRINAEADRCCDKQIPSLSSRPGHRCCVRRKSRAISWHGARPTSRACGTLSTRSR